jgi:PKD repeat protein
LQIDFSKEIKMKKILSVAVLLTAFFVAGFSQSNIMLDESKDYASYPYWIDMMQDEEANFYATVEAFNRYWENREITPGSGYKPFKRWEYHWSTRINPDGTRRPGDEAIKSYLDFMATSIREDHFEGDWDNLGPIEQPGNAGTGQPNGNGRVNALAFHPTNADIIYAGAPAGGLWITYDGGENWHSYTDDLPTLGVSSIVIDYTDPDIVFIGTGDRDAGDAPGMGVMKSEDGGVTFEFSNEGMGNATVGMMIMHPDFHLHMLAATSNGIYKTTDGGDSWSNKKGGSFKDIVYHVNDPDIVYATSSGSFFRSTDAGDTWTRITSGLSSASRGVIGVSADDEDVVYFHTVQGSVYAATYRSDDAGLNFTIKATSPNIMSWGCNGGSGGQGWYDLDVAVDPTDADVLYSGGVNVWKSSNGAASWNINAHWYGDCGRPAVHADCHILEYNPVDGRLYAGNDGGVYWTDDGGNTWNEITSGLAISQVYKIGQSATNPDKVINGYQDNGTATYLGETDGWLTVMGGDGMDCAYDHKDDRYAYGEYYNGAGISRIYNNINQGSIGNGIGESGAWVTPLALDVEDPQTMYVGMKNIWVSNNIRSGNVQWKNISNIGSSNCNVIEQSEADRNIFYVGKWSDALWRTDNLLDENPTWINLSSQLPTSGTPTDIEAHPENTDVVYMTLNYKVFKSADRGQNWEDITLNLPTASTNTIEYYKGSRDGIYVGTDAGIYYLDNDMDEWVIFSAGFPLAADVTEIEIYYSPDGPSGDLVRTSTYGRGLWSSPTYYATPEADFIASETQIPAGCAVDFMDLSGGVPHEWEWTFEGATTTTSSERNPVGIVYEEEGTFAVTLTVTNPIGTDTKTVTAYITVSDAMLPLVDFMSPDTVFCVPGIARFYEDSQGCPTTWSWDFGSGNYTFMEDTDENSQNPVVKFYDNEPYTVSLTVTNSAGSTTETKDDYIQSGGYTPYFSESFEFVTLGSTGWEVENPDNKVTWELFETGGTEPGSVSAGIDFSNYQVVGQRDRLISPPFNLKGVSSAWLEFQHAYAERWENKTDSLIVYISDDCGSTWTRIYADGEDGSGRFATREPSSDFWPETVTDWCAAGWGSSCIAIDLSNWVGNDGVKIAFESWANFGNPMFIDNVTISQFVGQDELITNSAPVMVFPNPNSGTFKVDLGNEHNFNSLQIVNHLGQLIYRQKISITEREVNLDYGDDLLPGIYYLQINGNKETVTEKIIIN